jgi:hypothetical protein
LSEQISNNLFAALIIGLDDFFTLNFFQSESKSLAFFLSCLQLLHNSIEAGLSGSQFFFGYL